MSNDSSLQENVFTFDLDSQKGITHLLTSLRISDISADQKNELRDLIFQYTNGGRDNSTKIDLEQKIIAYAIIPVAANGSFANKPDLTFGSLRNSPTFSPLSISQEVKTKLATPHPVPVKQPVPQIATTTPQSEVVLPAPVRKNPSLGQVPVPVVEKAVIPEPVLTPLPQTPPVVPVEIDPQLVSTEPQVSPASPPVVVKFDPNRSAFRIKEIKSIVNDKVGNPVNLVNIDNEVGREYMAALLDAMKKQSSGTSVISAMKRLEVAFISVEKTLKSQGQKISSKKVEKKEVSTPDIKTTEVRNNNVPIVPEEKKAPAQSVEVKKNTLTDLPVAVRKPVKEIPVPTPVQTDVRIEVADGGLKSGFETTVNPASLPKPVESKVVKNTPTDLPVKAKTVKSADSKTVSVAIPLSLSDVKLHSLSDLPSPSEIDTSSTSGDIMFTKQVDSGLNQLLSEWSIFKKSGLFGTGPKGFEHPLFKQVSNLPIPLLLSGRFEGSTQEVKQSITDYMNGWRYEQGIIYEHGETFEHYLRRVVSHILDLQLKNQSS